MALWRCVACGTKFAVGLRMCPQCTSENAVEDSEDARAQLELAATYDQWTKEQLQDELERRDLPKTGNKPDLIRRLLDNPPGGKNMPKISAAGGPSDARQPDDVEVTQRADGTWDGTSYSTSTEKPPTSGEQNSLDDQSPAPTTENLSETDQTAYGTAPSTGGEKADRRAEYEDWTKEDLQAELERRDLPKSGNKDELVARLVDYDKSSGDYA